MGIDYDRARVLLVPRLTNHTIQWPGDTQDQTGLGAQYLYIIILCIVYYPVIPIRSSSAHLRSITSAGGRRNCPSPRVQTAISIRCLSVAIRKYNNIIYAVQGLIWTIIVFHITMYVATMIL